MERKRNTNGLESLSATINAAYTDENFNPSEDDPIPERPPAPTAPAQRPPPSQTPPPSPPPNPHVPAPPPLTLHVVDNPLVHVLHKWIPITVHITFITYIDYLEFFIDIGSTKRTFEEGVVMLDDEWKRAIPCLRQGFSMH